MHTGAIATRYAKSFFGFCRERNDLDAVYPVVKQLVKALSNQVKLRELIVEKTLTEDEKIDLLERIINQTLPPSLHEFIKLIIKKNRASLLLPMLLIFRRSYLESKGILDVELWVAEELNEKSQEKTTRQITKTLGSPCEIEVKVKKELIAGYTLIVNGRVFDSSVKGQLNSVKKNLLEKNFDNK